MRRRPGRILLSAIAAVSAVLAFPAQATASEPRTVELRVQLRGDSAPEVAAAFQPGGELDLAGAVEIVGGTQVDPKACDATIATSGEGATAITLSQCAGTDVTAVIDVTTATAAVTVRNTAGTGTTKLSLASPSDGGTVGIGAVIDIVIVVLLV